MIGVTGFIPRVVLENKRLGQPEGIPHDQQSTNLEYFRYIGRHTICDLIPRTYFSSIFANRNQVFEESSESLPYIVLFDGGNHFVFVLDSPVSTPGFCTFLN